MDKSGYRSLACFLLLFDSRDVENTRRLKSAGYFIRPSYSVGIAIDVCPELSTSPTPRGSLRQA
jgi:hypothetical protein